MTRRVILVVALAVAPVIAGAQAVQPELRLDLLGPPPVSVQPGAGLTMPLGYYVRVTGSAGYALAGDDRLIANRWRADLSARFTLDPFRNQRWALALGGGLSVRRRTYLLAIAELEGPQMGSLMPALQAGASGGWRAALILRRAVPGRR